MVTDMSQYIFEEPGRQIAHVLVDSAVAYQADAESNVGPVNLALSRISDIEGSVPVSVDESDEVTVDVSHLLGSALIAVNWLLDAAAGASGQDRDLVAADLRAFLDSER